MTIFGTLFFKFPCILRICAWFLMHFRNDHSDSHANHVIKHIYIPIHIVRLSEPYIVTSINVPPIIVIPAGVDLMWPGRCQDPSDKSLSHERCPRLNTTRAPEWPTIRDGNKRNLKGRPGSLLLGCYWAFYMFRQFRSIQTLLFEWLLVSPATYQCRCRWW